MRKSEWYENRILWRAQKLRMESYAWRQFSQSNEQAAKRVLEDAVGTGSPLFIFWSSDRVWTLLTDQFLIGILEGILSSVALDELRIVSTVSDESLPPEEVKRMAELITAGDRKKFWMPAGNAHFALRNLLMMFPLKTPQ